MSITVGLQRELGEKTMGFYFLDKGDKMTLEEKLKELWYKRNPSHETDNGTGKDLFWGTVICVIKDLLKDEVGITIIQQEIDDTKHPNKFKIGEIVKISILSKYYEHVDKDARFKIVEIKLNRKNEIEYTLNEIGDSRTGYTDEWLDIDLEPLPESPKEK